FLISLKSRSLSRRNWLEKGMTLAAIAAVLLGAADFLVGLGARATSPLLVNWFIDITLTAYTLVYISFRRGLRKVVRNLKKMPMLLLATCTFDNFAWISYAFATVLMPITIAAAISENYIALAAILGLVINREHLMAHQKLGLVIALSSAVVLSLMV
ncbi:MAG: EamA family transporter, partial [Candidatus Micrarchaeales archaeon]